MTNTTDLSYKNPNLPAEERITDLLGRMTLEEKVGQMMQLDARSGDLDDLIDQYVLANTDTIKSRLLPVALEVFHRHREAGDRVIVATGAPPELARAILAFVAHEDVPVIGTQVGPRLGAIGAIRHCHHEMKVRMIREAGYTAPIQRAYTDSSADLPLLLAAETPVVVNPKAQRIDYFRERLPPGTPMLNWGCPDRAGTPVAPA